MVSDKMKFSLARVFAIVGAGYVKNRYLIAECLMALIVI